MASVPECMGNPSAKCCGVNRLRLHRARMFTRSTSSPISVVTGGAGFLGSHLTDRLLAATMPLDASGADELFEEEEG